MLETAQKFSSLWNPYLIRLPLKEVKIEIEFKVKMSSYERLFVLFYYEYLCRMSHLHKIVIHKFRFVLHLKQRLY